MSQLFEKLFDSTLTIPALLLRFARFRRRAWSPTLYRIRISILGLRTTAVG